MSANGDEVGCCTTDTSNVEVLVVETDGARDDGDGTMLGSIAGSGEGDTNVDKASIEDRGVIDRPNAER